MRARRFALTTLLLIATASPALAAATPEGAAKLTSLFQSYLGKEPGVVTVAPEGDVYALTLDFNPLFAKANPADFTGKLSPFAMKLTERGGGKWQVDQDQAVEFAFKGGGVADISGKLASLKGTGVFDEALGYFESSSGTIAGFTYSQVIAPPGEGAQSSQYSIDTITYETAMKPSGSDAADGTSRYTATNLVQKISIPASPAGGTPPIDATVSFASMSQDAKVTGIKFKPLTNIVSFIVAHPSKELMIRDQGALKDALRAALPVFARTEGTAVLDGMKVATPFGEFAASKLTVDVAMNGVVADGYLRERLAFEGLVAPQVIVPPWAADLVPTRFTFDFDVSGFDLAAPAAMMLDKLDLSKEPPLPKDLEQPLLAALLPKGVVNLGLGPTTVVTKISELNVKGGMTAGPMARPAGEATVSLTGFDALLAAIQAVPPEMGMGQAIPALMMAKGMSKSGDNGALTWEIKSTPEGSVTINGVDPTKM